jgi:hypothetical protein
MTRNDSKHEKKRVRDKSTRRPAQRHRTTGDARIVHRLTDVIDWALDIARRLSREDENDREAIENVRAFVRAWLEGRRADVPLSDVLTTIGILFAAIDLDPDIESISLLAPLQTMLDVPTRLPAVLRCPGSANDNAVVIRRFPGHRNASAATTHLAA